MKIKMKISVRSIILCSLFAALTAIGAFVKVPLPFSVPITLQFMFVALSGVLLGARDGMLSQLVYVVIGLIGFPVFTAGGGPQYIFNPTFGYLIGFIVSAFVMGYMTEQFKTITIPKLFLACSAGLLIVYLFGVAHLYIIKNLYANTPAALGVLIYNGALIFLPKDILSAFIAVTLCKKLIPAVKASLSKA